MALADPGARRYVYADLELFPDDNLRRELIDGELFVTASPITRHQRAVTKLVVHLFNYQQTHGGEVLPAPMDVVLSDDNVVAPDVIFIRADHMEVLGESYVTAAPDLVVEVSSPSTRRTDLTRKRDLYQRFGVPEYWFVDLEADRVEIYRLVDGRYPAPSMRFPGESIESAQLSGFAMPAEQALAIGAEPASVH